MFIKCKHIIEKKQDNGFPLYKCSYMYGIKTTEHFLNIRKKLKNDNIAPDGECPFAKRNILLTECPYFEK